MNFDLGKVITAMVTPFSTDGEVDYAKARKLAKALVKTGSDGLLVGGSTGESPALSEEEKLRLFSEIKDEVKDTAFVLAGSTDNNYNRSVLLTKKAEKAGVDCILLTVPAYNKPTQVGLYEHFKGLAGETNLPCVLYNVPGRTITNLDIATTLKLAEIPNIVAIKESSADLIQIARIIRDKPEGFTVISGDDSQTLHILAMGGKGVVSVASNVIGLQIRRLVELMEQNKVQQAGVEHLRLFEFLEAIFMTTSPLPIRYALKRYCDFDVGTSRLPLCEPDSSFKAKFDQVIKNYGYKMDVATAL